MEPEIVMPAPLIKEEDISEDVIIDLDKYRSIEDVTEEWELKIFEHFKRFFIADEHNLTKLMKWYIQSLKEDAVNILKDDALKSYILRHINFFKLHFVEVGGCFADSYLDSLEEILTIYCNLEVKLLPKKLGNAKNYVKRYKRRISLIMHQLVVLARHCLLDREERLLHVFMKMNVAKDSEEARIFFNLLFAKFLTVVPKEKGDLAFCRAYILCQKWKEITEEEEWPKMDKMVYTAFQKTAVSINSNETLKSILLPQNDSVLNLITHKSNDPSVLCEAYFKYIRSETFHELDDLTQLEITESDDEDFLPFDSHDELDDGAFVKAYRTYVKSMKPVSTFYKNLSQQHNSLDKPVERISDPEDSECCIVSVGTRDVNPSDTQIVHELSDDDDIAEIIYFIKKDPPPTRKKKNLNKSFYSALSLPAATSGGRADSPVEIKRSPLCSNLKQGVTIETQTEADFTRGSRQGGQEDVHKRFYEVLTPPSDQNIEENTSELSVYTNIVSPDDTEHISPQDKSKETTITINDEVIFESEPANSIEGSLVNNSISHDTSPDSVGLLLLDANSSTSNCIESGRPLLTSSVIIGEAQGYTKQIKSYVSPSSSNTKKQDNVTKNVVNTRDIGSDNFLEDLLNGNSEDNYIQKEVPPPTEKRTEPNSRMLESMDVLLDTPTLSKTFTSITTSTECTSCTSIIEQDNDKNENKNMERAKILSPLRPALIQGVTIETQTESDFTCISQQGRLEDINKEFYGILTPPSDQNIEENITKLSVYTKIFNPKSAKQKALQKHSKDNSAVENEVTSKGNSIAINQNCTIEDNFITPVASLASARLFSVDTASSMVTCRESSPSLHSSNNIVSDITNSVQEFEPYISSLLDNTKNQEEDAGNDSDDTFDNGFVMSTDLDENCKSDELSQPAEEQREPNVLLLNSVDVLSDTATSSKSFISHSSSMNSTSGTTIIKEHNVAHENKNKEHAKIPSGPLCPDLSRISQQGRQKNINKRFYGILTLPSDRNKEENLTEVSIYSKIVNPKSTHQKASQEPSNDSLTVETEVSSEDNPIVTNKDCRIKDNLITPDALLASAGLLPADTGVSEMTCRKSNSPLCNTNISDYNTNNQDVVMQNNLEVGDNVDVIFNGSPVRGSELEKNCKSELANGRAQRNDELFEKPKPPKIKELKVAIPNMDLVVTAKQEMTNNNVDKKIMFTSPLKVTRAELSDFCYFEDTLHKKWQQIRATNTLDDFLCGPVEKINGSKNCLGLDKSFDLFENSDSQTTTPSATPNTTPTTSSTELTSPAYEEGLDDFRNFYDEKKCRNNVAGSTSSSPSPDRSQNRKRPIQALEGYSSNMPALSNDSTPIPVKRKRIAIDETIREHHPSTIEVLANLNTRNPPKGILKKFSTTYLEAKRNTLMIPKSKMSIASLEQYGVSPTDHQLQSVVCVVLERISKHEITQWLRVSEISRKVRMEKEGHNWYAFECLNFKNGGPSMLKNGISQVKMPGTSTSGKVDGLITQWRSPAGLFPNSFNIRNTVGLPTVNHQSTSDASKGMVDTSLATDCNDNYSKLSGTCNGACCQHIAVAFRKLQISIPKVHSASTSTIRNPFQSLESGTEKRRVGSQENTNNDVVIKFVPDSNVIATPQLAVVPIPEPAVVPISEPVVAPIPEPAVAPIPEHAVAPIPEPVVAPIPQPTVVPIPQSAVLPESQHAVVPIPQPAVVPELGEFEKILNMKASTIPLDLQNLDLRRLSPSPVINSFSPQHISLNSAFITDCLLNENLVSPGNMERYRLNSQILCNEYIDSMYLVEHPHQDEPGYVIDIPSNRVSEISHEDEQSYTTAVDVPSNRVCEEYLQGKPSDDTLIVHMSLNRVCEKHPQGELSYNTAVDIPLNNNISVMSLQNELWRAVDKPLNKVSEKGLQSEQNYKIALAIPHNKICEVLLQDEQNLNRSVDTPFNKHRQCEQSDIRVEILPNRVSEKPLKDEQSCKTAVNVSNRVGEKPLEDGCNYNRSADILLNRVCEKPFQNKPSYSTDSNISLNGVHEKPLQCNTAVKLASNSENPLNGKESCSTVVEVPSVTVCEKPRECEQSYNTEIDTLLNRVRDNSLHGEQTSNTVKEILPTRVCEKPVQGEQIYDTAVDMLLNRVCEIPLEVGQSYNTVVDKPLNRIYEVPLQDRMNFNKTEDRPLNTVFEKPLQCEKSYEKTVEISSNKVCQKTHQVEQIHNTVVDIPLTKVCDKRLQNEQSYDTTVHIPLNRISDIPLQDRQTYTTVADISLNGVSKKPLQGKDHYDTPADSQPKIVHGKTLQIEQNCKRAPKILVKTDSDNSPQDEQNYNTMANLPLDRDFDVTDTTIKTDYKSMKFEEIETCLPLKKRKLSVANCTDEDGTDDFLCPDLVEEILKRARSEDLQKEDISYPAKPMISIAEVQEELTEQQQPRVFRTPAEKKEMPPPPPQAAQVNFLETPKIITEQYNNHTYNNPTINYHMNNVPYTFFPCASIPYFPPIILPMSGTTTFDMNLITTPQQQQQQPQTTNAPNGMPQSCSTQGATTRTRRNRKTTEDRVKTDGH